MSSPFLPLAVLAGGLSFAFSSLAAGQNSEIQLLHVSHGFGQVLPHRMLELDDAGAATGALVELRSLDQLNQHARGGNGLLPSPILPQSAVLPNGLPGNHFLVVSFDQELDYRSVFQARAGGVPAGLAAQIELTMSSPDGGPSVPVAFRAFLGGRTLGDDFDGSESSLLTLVEPRSDGSLKSTSVDVNGDGQPDGLGFPGTQGAFEGALGLLSTRALVLIPDADGDLATHETFPAGGDLSLRIAPVLGALSGDFLREPIHAGFSVGSDRQGPELLRAPRSGAMHMLPVSGSTGVDPASEVHVFFSEAIQLDVAGPLAGGVAAIGSPALSYGGSLNISMPVTARPQGPFALDHWILTPAIPFPGIGSDGLAREDLHRVGITSLAGSLQDLAGNSNASSAFGEFEVGVAAGLVNAPVAPDAILIGRSGPASISVLDLNGFGGSTGNPRYVDGAPQPGHTNFPYNPNVRFQPMIPPLQPGTTTLDGGSAGVFTLTLDSNLSGALSRAPVVADVSDMAIGHALDGVFNNALFPFGCQMGGGEICAIDGAKLIAFDDGLQPETYQTGGLPAGTENLLSWAPHPNPPPLTFPPLCVDPSLMALEPSSVDNLGANLLVPGDPFGDPTGNPALPPSGLFSLSQNSYFQGHTQGKIQLSDCEPYMIRQQVGHFEYVLDRQREQLLILNSNRQTVLDRIPMKGAARLALSPELDFLAITQRSFNQVSFLDVDPNSSSFHQVIKQLPVGAGPMGIAWQPGNEDILVCNELEGSLSVISAFTLFERKRVTGFLDGGPFEVAILPRQVDFSFDREVYYAGILQRDGSLAIFESGPDGATGWGYDDVIGVLPFQFQEPKAIMVDPEGLQDAAFWVAHEGAYDPASGQFGPAGEGAISRVVIDSALPGRLILGGMAGQPQFRQVTYAIEGSLGEPQLSGIPVDLAMDDLNNLAALPNVHTDFSSGAPVQVNGRGLVRRDPNFTIVAAKRPRVLLAAVPNGSQPALDVVDVIQVGVTGLPLLDTNAFEPGLQSVPVRGVRILVDAYRQ